MGTVGDQLRPYFPGVEIPNESPVTVQRAVPVGPAGSPQRAAFQSVFPGLVLKDDDWVIAQVAERHAGDQLSTYLLDDNFDGTAINPANWIVVSGTPVVSDGRLRFSNAYPSGMVRFVQLAKFASQTMTVYGMVVTPETGSSGYRGRGIKIDNSTYTTNFLQFSKTGPSLIMNVSGTPATTAVYNPTAHANLRIREFGGQVFYEVSPDGTTWTALRTSPTPEWVKNREARYAVFGGSWNVGGDSTVGDQSFDRVTIGPS